MRRKKLADSEEEGEATPVLVKKKQRQKPKAKADQVAAADKFVLFKKKEIAPLPTVIDYSRFRKRKF